MFQFIAKRMLAAFDRKYQTDSSYLRALLRSSPSGFRKFIKVVPLSRHRKALSVEAKFVAHLTATQAADCGDCLQLVVRMAQEAGVSEALIKQTLYEPEALPAPLDQVRAYAHTVAKDQSLAPEKLESLKSHYSNTEIAELALTIASARTFPILKRALGFSKTCSQVRLEV